VELYIHSSNTPSRRGSKLKHRDNFTFMYLFKLFGKRLLFSSFMLELRVNKMLVRSLALLLRHLQADKLLEE